MYGLNRRSKKAAAAEQSHKFWNTQPVPQDAASDYGPIETKTVDQVRKAPYKLPASFEWDDLDVSDEKSVRILSPRLVSCALRCTLHTF